MKFKSELVTAVCGSIGGTSYLTSRSGMIRQAKPKPTNTSSPQQRTARAIFQTLAIAWRDSLTQAQRDSWTNYAKSTPVTGCLGDTLVLTGSQMFLRCNSLRHFFNLAIVSNGPTTPGLDSTGPIQVFVNGGDPFLFVVYDRFSPWAIEIGGAIVVRSSRWLAQARNSYKAKTRFLAADGRAPFIPSGFFQLPANAYGQLTSDSTTGQKFLVEVITLRVDGRISNVRKVFHTLT